MNNHTLKKENRNLIIIEYNITTTLVMKEVYVPLVERKQLKGKTLNDFLIRMITSFKLYMDVKDKRPYEVSCIILLNHLSLKTFNIFP